jgi:hypothetical protein
MADSASCGRRQTTETVGPECAVPEWTRFVLFQSQCHVTPACFQIVDSCASPNVATVIESARVRLIGRVAHRFLSGDLEAKHRWRCKDSIEIRRTEMEAGLSWLITGSREPVLRNSHRNTVII